MPPKNDTGASASGSKTTAPKKDTGTSTSGSKTTAPKKDTGTSASGSKTTAPKKDTGTSASGSKTSAPAGQGAGVKRPAPGNAPAAGNTPAAGRAHDLPTRSRSGVNDGRPPSRPGSGDNSPPRSDTTGSNPSRPGSSGGYDLHNFSYYHLGADNVEREISSDSDEFRLVADIYHIGWQRFNHAETKKHLVHLGRECANDWTSPVNKSKYNNYKWPGDVRNMVTYLDNYLKGLRAMTPAIMKRAMKASERTYALSQPKETYMGDLDSVLVTRDLFHLELFDHLAEHLLDAYQKHEDDRYQGLRMLGAACFFHELVHGFVFFIMGRYFPGMIKVGTPPEFRAAWDEGDELDLEAVGESGFYMEDIIFGGTVQMSPWLQPLGAKNAQSKLTCVNENGRRIEIPAEIAKAFNKDPKGYDIKKSVTDVFKSAAPTQVPSHGRAAKRMKINQSGKPGSKTRMQAWHLEFQYNSDHSAVTSLNKTTAPPA